MASDDFHLWIPDGDIYADPFKKKGFGKPYTRENYSEHGKMLASRLRDWSIKVGGRKDSQLTKEYFVQIETPASLPIRGERFKLREMGFELVAFSGFSENKGTALIKRNMLEALESKITKYTEESGNPGKRTISVLEDLREVPAEDKIEIGADVANDSPVPSVVALYSMLTDQEKRTISSRIAQDLTEKGKRGVRVHTYVDGSVVVTAELSSKEMLEIGEEYVTVRSIGLNGQALVTRSTTVGTLPTDVIVDAPSITTPVAVVDTGVNPNGVATSGLVVDHLVHLPPGTISTDYTHGTFVASRVLYDDAIHQQIANKRLRPWCPIIDVQVFGVNATGDLVGPSETQLASVLQLVVPQLVAKTRVFNLSLGIDSPATQYKFSTLTKVIDFLSREHGVLFVIAAGNIKEPISGHPSQFTNGTARVQPPANSLLGISVGSVAKHIDINALAHVNEISPFSCIGPGSDDGLKPEVVAHGGNLVAPWSNSPRCGAYGLSSDAAGFAYGSGTSYAAPIVAQYAARIFHSYPSATANLVKALLCHFCDEVTKPAVIPSATLHCTGFGEPVIDRALSGVHGSAVLIHQGTIQDATYQHIRFHVPSCLASDVPDTQLFVRATLVYDPPVNPDNGVEYSKSRISVALFKNSSTGLTQVALGGNDYDYSQAWSPVIHFEKKFSRAYLAGEWELRLRLVTRGVLPVNFTQSYALVLEVLDGNGVADVRGEILKATSTRYRPVILRFAA